MLVCWGTHIIWNMLSLLILVRCVCCSGVFFMWLGCCLPWRQSSRPCTGAESCLAVCCWLLRRQERLSQAGMFGCKTYLPIKCLTVGRVWQSCWKWIPCLMCWRRYWAATVLVPKFLGQCLVCRCLIGLCLLILACFFTAWFGLFYGLNKDEQATMEAKQLAT